MESIEPRRQAADPPAASARRERYPHPSASRDVQPPLERPADITHGGELANQRAYTQRTSFTTHAIPMPIEDLEQPVQRVGDRAYDDDGGDGDVHGASSTRGGQPPSSMGDFGTLEGIGDILLLGRTCRVKNSFGA